MAEATKLRNRIVLCVLWIALSVAWAGAWAWEVSASLTSGPGGTVDGGPYSVALAMVIVGIVSGVAALVAVVVLAVFLRRSPDASTDEIPPVIAGLNEIGNRHWPYGQDNRRR